MDDEQDLMARARAFDEAALATIFDRYYGVIYRYLYFHTGHKETAEDLSGQVFRRLLDALRAGAGPERHLKAWLFRVAANLNIDEARRGQHREHLPLDESLGELETALEDGVEQKILVARLHAALDELTAPQRTAIILRYLMEMPNEDAAQIMETTVGAVKALQQRALASLRRAMDEENEHEQAT